MRACSLSGGDSASEYCQYLVQKNNAVTLSYRKQSFTRMNEINRESILALADRGEVKVMYGSEVLQVKDEGRKPSVVFKQEGTQEFDYVVYALGGTTPEGFLRMLGIEFDGDEPRMTEEYETNIPGMFLIGDLSAGTKGGSIIWAFNSANTAMKRINASYVGL